ncbi:MAG: hypothetical protein P8I82_00360 [Flavobacteriales bacterium]|nr:hypothetical protein [Flavobacteriales bacterium]
MGDFMANYGIILTYILIAAATIAAIAFPIKHLISHPKKAKQVGIGLGALLVIYIIAALSASDEVTEHFMKFDVTASQSKQVGTGLIVFYILAVGALLVTLYTEISKMLNK